MASAFSICALVENWRVSIPSGSDEARGLDQKDPKWYDEGVQRPIHFGGSPLL